jgi:hypothetical protein
METEEPLISMAEEPEANVQGVPIVPAQEIAPVVEPEISRVIGREVVLERTVLEAGPPIDLAAAQGPIARLAADPALNLQIDPAVDQVVAATESATAPLHRVPEVAEGTVPSAAAVAAATAGTRPAPAAAVEEKAWEAAG